MFARSEGLKRSIWAATLLGGGLILSPPAAADAAEEGWYLVGNFAIPQLDEPLLPGEPPAQLVDPENLLSGTFGYRNGAFRAEGQFLYQEEDESRDGFEPLGGPTGRDHFPLNAVIDRETRAMAVMANGYYDYAVTPRWRLFAGAGLGLARLGAEADPNAADPLTVDQPSTGQHHDDTVLAYQGMLGLSYDVSAPLQLFVGYRYFATEAFGLNSSDPGLAPEDLSAHSGLVGFRYNF